MNNFYTYLYTDPIRNEPIYVGYGHGQRAFRHLKNARNSWLRNRIGVIRKAGQEPVISFLCKDEDEEFAKLVEMEAISKFGRRDIGKGSLLNFTDGGEGSRGFKMPKDACERIGKASSLRVRSEETKRKAREGNTGKKRSPETCRRMSEAHKRRDPATYAHSEQTKAKMALAAQARPSVQCPHCSKSGGISQMKRWHFENCKFK